jgi:hypothetical protein
MYVDNSAVEELEDINTSFWILTAVKTSNLIGHDVH